MAAPTEYYVDPSLGSDTGDGTVGTPWGRASGSVVQFALDTITRDATNGDRLNIKATTDDVLAASLSFTNYGVPTIAVPIIIQGYSTAAGDFGVGGIDGAATYGMFADPQLDFIHLVDLHCHNSGSANIIKLDNSCIFTRLEVNNTSGSGIVVDLQGVVLDCNIHDIGTYGCNIGIGSHVSGCYFANGTKSFINTIYGFGGHGEVTVQDNILSISGSSSGIVQGFNTSAWSVTGNSILCATGGTGEGIIFHPSGNLGRTRGNLVEGFSGAGGRGIVYITNNHQWESRWNGVFNSTTAYNNPEHITTGDIDNETLNASPFAKVGADTFDNRFRYFAPRGTGNVIGGLPNGQDKGAVQRGRIPNRLLRTLV